MDAMADDIPGMYGELRARVTTLVAEAGGDAGAARVPACPDWSVKDVLAHLAGICADVLGGNIEGVATDPWTAAQVEARRGHSVEDILAEWNELGPQVEALAPVFPEDAIRQWLTDGTTHEHDVFGALARTGARDAGSVGVSLDFTAANCVEAASTSGTAVGFRAGERAWGRVDGDAPVLTADAFDLLRALTGRRSLAQVRAMAWEGDADAALAAFTWGPFRPATADIVE